MLWGRFLALGFRTMLPSDSAARAPLLTVQYVDPEEGTRGYLVIDSLVQGVAAGGLRIQPGLSVETLGALARNMTLKQAVAGLQVGGAKAGLDLDAASPQRPQVLRRFLRALRPLILECYSVGPDVNTSMDELEEAAREVGIASLKLSVGRSRGLSDEEFLRRYALFWAPVPGGTVNDFRAATAVLASTRVLAETLGVERPRVALQGAGTIGGAAARLLSAAGMRVVAWADDEKCLVDEGGLDVEALLSGRRAGRLPAGGRALPSEEVLRAPADVLVLGAISHAFGTDALGRLGCRAIIEAANLALTPEVEEALHARGIWVVPDVVASVGGSLAVEALYAAAPSDGPAILRHVEQRVSTLAREALATSRQQGMTPRAAAYSRVRARPGASTPV